jgi:hypothetical protein
VSVEDTQDLRRSLLQTNLKMTIILINEISKDVSSVEGAGRDT